MPVRLRDRGCNKKRSISWISHWPSNQTLTLWAILAITSLVYLECLGNGFVTDDKILIVNNSFLGKWSFLWKSLFRDEFWVQDPLHLPQSPRYRPLLQIWFGLNYHLFGMSAFGWHAMMVGVHVLAAWLVFKLATCLSGDRWAALLATLLFATLPVHVQAVVWPSGFGVVLSAALQMGALYFFIKRADSPRRNWPLALGLYAGALLSHESAASFPALIALFALLLDSSRTDGEAAGSSLKFVRQRAYRMVASAAPFAAEVLAYMVVRAAVLGPQMMGPRSMGTASWLMTAPRVLAEYLKLLTMGWLASAGHRVLVVASLRSLGFLVPIGVLALLTAAFGLTRSRRRNMYLFCLGWIGIGLAPVMYLPALRADLLVQDYYLYFASAASCVLIADVLARLSRRGTSEARLAWVLSGALVLSYAFATWRLQGVWRSNVTLLTRCVEDLPQSEYCHSQLGMALMSSDLTKSQSELRKAYELNPSNGSVLYNLGEADAQLGRVAQGTGEVAAGLRLMDHPPARAYMVLSELYDMNGQPQLSEQVISYIQSSLSGGVRAAGLARARIAMNHGDNSRAVAILDGLTHHYPRDYRLWAQLGQALAAEGRNGEALAAQREAARVEVQAAGVEHQDAGS